MLKMSSVIFEQKKFLTANFMALKMNANDQHSNHLDELHV